MYVFLITFSLLLLFTFCCFCNLRGLLGCLPFFDGICLDVDDDGPGESSVDVIVDVDGVDIL